MIFGPKPSAPPQPDIRCKCGASEFTRICRIESSRYTTDGIEWREIGARVSCQRCANVFSITHLGAFDHDPRALPPSPLLMAPRLPAPEEPYRRPPEQERLTPIARPRT